MNKAEELFLKKYGNKITANESWVIRFAEEYANQECESLRKELEEKDKEIERLKNELKDKEQEYFELLHSASHEGSTKCQACSAKPVVLYKNDKGLFCKEHYIMTKNQNP